MSINSDERVGGLVAGTVELGALVELDTWHGSDAGTRSSTIPIRND